MRNNYRKAFDAGKGIHEKDSVNLLIVLIAIVLDSIVTFFSFESVSSDTYILKIVLAAGAVFLLDYTPSLLAVELFKKHKPAIKATIILLLVSIIILSAGLLAKFRLETVGNMFRPTTGLLGEMDVPPEIYTLGIVMAFIPIGTSILIFCHSAICFNPNKRVEDLKIMEIESRDRVLEYNAALSLYDGVFANAKETMPNNQNSNNSEDNLKKIVDAKYEAAKKEISLAAEQNKLLFAKMLSEKLNANSEELEILMENSFESTLQQDDISQSIQL